MFGPLPGDVVNNRVCQPSIVGTDRGNHNFHDARSARVLKDGTEEETPG